MAQIAERKLATEVLRQSEDSLRLIIDTIPRWPGPLGLTVLSISSISVRWIMQASLWRSNLESRPAQFIPKTFRES